MRIANRLLAAFIACSLAAQPALAQVKVVGVKAVAPNVSAAAGAAGVKALAPLSFTPTSLQLNSAVLPSVENLQLQPSSQLKQLSQPAAVVGPSASAVKETAPAKTVFQKKLNAIGKAVEDAGRGAENKSAEGGKLAADKQFHALGISAGEEDFAQLFEESLSAWEKGALKPAAGGSTAKELLAEDTPHFTGEQLQHIRQASRAMEAAVTKAAAQLLPGAGIRAVSRGSSARLTQDDTRVDYDIMAALPADWSADKVHSFMQERRKDLSAALESAIREEAAALFPGQDIEVEAGSYVQLSDPVTHSPDKGVYMLPVKVLSAEGKVLLDADVTFTNLAKYTNDYPGYFAAQLEQVAQLGGQGAVDEVLGSIRLAKRMFKEVVGAYKVWRGGPSGVGVEQMIMQSGRVESADKGQTVLEPGDFDKFMDRINDIAFDQDGRYRGLKQAARLWSVFNPFREPVNFLTHLSDKAWRRLADAARNYRMAKVAGRPVSFKELGYRRPDPQAALAASKPAELPVRETTTLAFGFTSAQEKINMQRAVREAVRALPESKEKIAAATLTGGRANKTNSYQLSLVVEGGAGMEITQLLRDQLSFSDRSVEYEGEAAVRKNRDLLVFFRAQGKSYQPKTLDLVQKAAKRLARHFKSRGSVTVGQRPGPGGEFMAVVKLEPNAEAAAVGKEIQEFFRTAGGGMRLTGVSLPAGVPTSQARAPKEDAGEESAGKGSAGRESAGGVTLEMLEKFTTHGPKPSRRGDAYLYAQGAKVLPAGFEAAWANRPEAGSGGGDTIQRSLLLRRGGKTYVLVPTIRSDGEPGMKPANVSPELAAGIITDTLVEAELRDGQVVSVKPIGSYAMDMMIGRARKNNGRWMLDALLRDGKNPKTLYGRMPLAGAENLKEGEIVQAFIKPDGRGYSAEAMLDLGAELTPEIVAREIALRHGARGYFEKAVIEQAEKAGASGKAPPKFRDLREFAFVTVDPIGAGDLDDAFYVEKHADGGYTWYLATADVDQFVPPGTPAFRTAARIGNTFYSIDKDGVPEYPMNHPVVSKYAASLLAGKDSLAMITRMRFGPNGEFLKDESEVFLGEVRVQGRYTYEQVVDLWQDRAGHGIEHVEQITLARELASKLDASDAQRGKLALRFQQVAHSPQADGTWRSAVVEEDPHLTESHKLIEELKVYGNRAIAKLLERITAEYGVPHISRVHPQQEEAINRKLRKNIQKLGLRWEKDENLWDFLRGLQERADLTDEGREVAQMLALMTRRTAQYEIKDADGHEGLALEAGMYDHPSTPIRRFADMYNRAILEAYLEGRDPREHYAAVQKDLTDMGFRGLEEYMLHLNGREAASKLMDREVDEFMSIYELAKPEHQGKTYRAYVKIFRDGRNPLAVLQLRDLPVSITLKGDEVGDWKLLDELELTIHGADPERAKVDASVRKLGRLPALK
ncbi:MAG: RNB domain-containing ribonuclease [Elusimicrobiota bacterium]